MLTQTLEPFVLAKFYLLLDSEKSTSIPKYTSLLKHLKKIKLSPHKYGIETKNKKEINIVFECFVTKSGLSYLQRIKKIPETWTEQHLCVEFSLLEKGINRPVVVDLFQKSRPTSRIPYIVKRELWESVMNGIPLKTPDQYFIFELLNRLSYPKETRCTR